MDHVVKWLRLLYSGSIIGFTIAIYNILAVFIFVPSVSMSIGQL